MLPQAVGQATRLRVPHLLDLPAVGLVARRGKRAQAVDPPWAVDKASPLQQRSRSAAARRPLSVQALLWLEVLVAQVEASEA